MNSLTNYIRKIKQEGISEQQFKACYKTTRRMFILNILWMTLLLFQFFAFMYHRTSKATIFILYCIAVFIAIHFLSIGASYLANRFADNKNFKKRFFCLYPEAARQVRVFAIIILLLFLLIGYFFYTLRSPYYVYAAGAIALFAIQMTIYGILFIAFRRWNKY